MTGFTNAGKNIASQFGMPLYGISGAPHPLGAMSGNQFWVNETTGSDGNTGGPQDPFATLTQALSLCVANNNDIIFMTGSVHVTATVAWNVARTHLIGLSPPSQNSRARIAIANTAATSGAVSPLVNVTATGCYFKNIEAFNGINQAATQVCWAEFGGQNYYENCCFFGVGIATAGAQAGNRSLTVGGDENRFIDCIIGNDTIVRATNANSTLEFLVGPGGTGSARNFFRGCVFQMLSSDASNVHVNAGAGSLDRWTLFDNCAFIQGIQSGQAAISAGITVAATGGLLLLQSPISVGATAIATTGNVYIVGTVPPAATSGIAILAT